MSAAAADTSNIPNSIQNSDAPASIVTGARFISKSRPRRSYGRLRWDL
jgi:hypothetical protein